MENKTIQPTPLRQGWFRGHVLGVADLGVSQMGAEAWATNSSFLRHMVTARLLCRICRHVVFSTLQSVHDKKEANQLSTANAIAWLVSGCRAGFIAWQISDVSQECGG